MKFAIKLAISLVVAVGLGYGSARWAIEKVTRSQSVHNGSWGINTTIGSSDVDPYAKAYVALHGLLALNKSEAIYFSAWQDSSGEPLDGSCTYAVSGKGIDARWWTITVYGADDFLIPTDGDKFALSVHELGSGDFSFQVGPHVTHDDQGLSTGDEKKVSLTLRAYNPDPSLLESLDTVELPTIEKEACS